MENFDNKAAARVWQRVHGAEQSGPDALELPALLHEQCLAAATYRNLAGISHGGSVATAQQLVLLAERHAACLRGIFFLITGQYPAALAPQPLREPHRTALRRCYGQEMRHCVYYERHTSDTEYGRVFSALAQEKQQICCLLTELLGQLEPVSKQKP